MKKKKNNEFTLKNKKAYFNYEIIENFDAGIMLIGSEVKSIRNSNVSFTDSYCFFENETELYVRNLHIDLYKNTSYNTHEPKRDRKLLLTKKELIKLMDKVKKQGMTILPLLLFFHNGKVKLKIGLAKGKKQYDKREAIKQKDLNREKDRLTKN
jgi:SsrA-binding protein